MVRKFFRKKKLKEIENNPNVNIIVNNFHGVNWHEKLATPVFAVYKSPKDFPGKYVVRLYDGKKPLRLVAVKNTLEEARSAIQQGPPFMFHNMGRFTQDDPVLVEAWI